jgi:error-prone DNA polymerase
MHTYVPLWCKSHYSFLEGASEPAEYVEICHQLGIRALALTDRDGVYGIVQAHLRAAELGIKLIVGSEITVDDYSRMILLARDQRGYENLCKLISRGRRRCPKGQSQVSWLEICEHAEGLTALAGGDNNPMTWDEPDLTVLSSLRDAFGSQLYAMLSRHHRPEERQREVNLRRHARHLDIPLVAATEVLYHTPDRRELQDILTCIRTGSTVSDIGNAIPPNDEHALQSPRRFRSLYEDDIRALHNTRRIAETCTFTLEEIDYRYPGEHVPDSCTEADWLEQLTWEGAKSRYPEGIPDDIRAQLKSELELIDELEYGGYFLTMKEIVDFCHAENIYCQGRGSAANSAVCYCLHITAIDPVRMGLLFERFLSRERAEPPDIDLDIEHQRREEVIQHVYDKYGRERAAMVANVIRYRPKSAIRDVGKALDIEQVALDRIAKLLPNFGYQIAPDVLAEAGLDPKTPINEHLLRLANSILDFPRHLSIHPGGFLLGHAPVHTIVPIENATMPNRTVIQWDKRDIEALGLFKVDLLGLGALTQVHRAFDLIEAHRGETWTMASVPSECEKTFADIRKADTVGVFQIESRAQMSMLPRLKPRTFYDLVIEVSIVRPGPITGGMVHPYLRRKEGLEPVVYPHPSLKPVLEKTLGVPLFQEQVMKLAVVAADYTPGEADQLRRDMAAWRQTGRIEQHRERLIERMVDKGILREFAERVFDQIRGFGEYGFPESHAASFALIAWITSWLKTNYHPEFTCSLLNSQPMGFYAPSTIVEDAKRHGIVIRSLDVSYSDWDCTLEPVEPRNQRDCHRFEEQIRAPTPRQHHASPNELEDTGNNQFANEPRHPFSIRMGMRYVRGLAEKSWLRIEQARGAEPFQGLEDFHRRTRLDRGTLEKLAEAGAFDSLEPKRREALWTVQRLCKQKEVSLPLDKGEQATGFEPLQTFEAIQWDYERSSHSSLGHPLEELREQLRAMKFPDSSRVRRYPNGRNVRYAGVVICRQRPGTASGVVFLTLEDELGFVNVIIWPDIYEKYASLVKTTSFLAVKGKLQKQSGVAHLIAREFWRPRLLAKPAAPNSHDFH